MTKKEAKKIVDTFKKAKFKCIIPNIVIEASQKLGLIGKAKPIKK